MDLVTGFLILALVAISREETCINKGKEGTCLKIWQCESALIELREGGNPVKCAGPRTVCCVNTETVPAATPEPTTEGMSAILFPGSLPNRCPPLASNITTPKIGKKAWDKCVDYQEQLIYPCEDSLLGKKRANYCNWPPGSLILSGEDAAAGEFPHMALLGYGKDTIDWICGGVIVSEKFILTAGHCTFSRTKGIVTKARIGILRRSDQVTDLNEYNIASVHKAPGYSPPLVYNDIALLETDRPMRLNKFAIPACLHDDLSVEKETAIVTGWGTTVARQRVDADYLQKVTLSKFREEECVEKLGPYRYMPEGFNRTSQICYGDRNGTKDSCQGDSGGPIQVKHPKLYCMYSAVGIISWGKWCGETGEPGIYTRISHFLPWIESIVWP